MANSTYNWTGSMGATGRANDMESEDYRILSPEDLNYLASRSGYTGPPELVDAFLMGAVSRDGTPITLQNWQSIAPADSGYRAMTDAIRSGEGGIGAGSYQEVFNRFRTQNPDLYGNLNTISRASSGSDWSDTLSGALKYAPLAIAAVGGYGAASGAGAGGFAGADAAGLAQMGEAAGLTGAELDAFVTSGGTMGSTAAGGGGIGYGASNFGGGGDYGASDYGFDGTGIEPGSGTYPDGSPAVDFPAIPGGTPTGEGGFNWEDLLKNVLSPGGSGGGGFNWNDLLRGVIGGVGGYVSADKMADAYREIEAAKLAEARRVADQAFAIGEPFREDLGASYDPGFNLMDEPGYGDAFGRASDIATRSWSARGGNPANNPGIQGSILNDVWSGSYLPALATYRGQLGQFGGLGLNTAGAAGLAGVNSIGSTDAVGAMGQGYNAIGWGLNTAMGGNPTDDDVLRRYGLTVGGRAYGR